MTAPLRTTAFALALFGSLAGPVRAGAAIVLRTEAEATGSVRLADIADIRGVSPELAGRLGAVVVETRLVDGMEIASPDVRGRLREEGFDLATLSFSGARLCVVSAAAPVAAAPGTVASFAAAPSENEDVEPTDLRSALALACADALGVSAEAIRIRTLRVDGGLGEDVRLAGEPQGECPGRVRVAVENDAGRPGELSALVSVRRTVACAARDVRPGETLSAADLATCEVDCRGGANEDYVADPAAVCGFEAKSSLRAGQPLRTRSVAPRRLVRRNALVLVKASTGGFELTLNAKALADGASGDVIPVENLSSRGRLLALVTGENELSLVETEGR